MEETEKASSLISLLWCLISFCIFHKSRSLLNELGIPESVALQGKVTKWKWVNTANSLLHSIVTGMGSLLCFYWHPQTTVNVVENYSLISHVLTAFSIGYFIFDFFDMLFNHKKRSSYELMVHHAFVVSCFSVSMLSKLYLGFVMAALVIEVNSIFLHWRQLLIICHYPQQSNGYRIVCLLNVFTFVVFRIIPLGWISRWLSLNQEKVAFPVYILGCVAMTGIVIMSSVLFLRILKSDYHSCKSAKVTVLPNCEDINSNKRKVQ